MKKSSKAFAVIGLGFGDEGKGLTVNNICKFLPIDDTIVVRYSGGQQAGHTVTTSDGRSHVFSNFGSGSFQGMATYWSKYCTVDPLGIFNEFDALKSKGVIPHLYIDKNAPVTTTYDKMFNQKTDAVTGHGTCGVGVGATFQREERFYSLLAGDLLFPSVVETKLELIRKYYKFDQRCTDNFLRYCEFVKDTFAIVDGIPNAKNYVFESSQGLLLDQNFGFFPHVTRSSVGTKNILEMGFEPELYLVTRAFQTRHGNGPMTNTHLPHNITDNPKETNILNRFQGEFRKSLLDLDLLKYGMQKDHYINTHPHKSLVITCLDLMKNEYRYTIGGRIQNCLTQEEFVAQIAWHLGINNVHAISSPEGYGEKHHFEFSP